MKWKNIEYGNGFESDKGFTIKPQEGRWFLRRNGLFLGNYETAGSCKRIAQCIWRELGVTNETMKI